MIHQMNLDVPLRRITRAGCVQASYRVFNITGWVLPIALVLSLAGCDLRQSESAAVEANVVPAWATEAVWYQIFVERFANGDPSNDPTLHDIQGSWPGDFPADWQVTPWTHQWYEQEAWARRTGRDFYHTVQMRRYGGDLEGVMDRLDYLQDLGVTALFFNPLNDAPSLHKYDARNYRHIDRNFGPDPAGDELKMRGETPNDPSTWVWTSADSLFLRLLDEIHARGMRAIMDYSWNHTGVTFWAWRDVLENQEQSEYADWYDIDRFDDPETVENEFSYTGWAGVRELPNLRKVGVPDGFHGGPHEGNLNDGARRHVWAVTRRWLDPNGDGDPSDGVDGFRLDVAEQLPLGFWRDYREFVKSINPEAFLVGEIWWEAWPEKMMDPRPYLGDIFDAVMNYRWYKATRSLVSGAPPRLPPRAYVDHLDSLESGIAPDALRAMMNVAATHDTPRLGTSLYNPGRYKFGVGARDNPAYRVDRPDARAEAMRRLLLVQQFTYYGAPHIWYGDEVGMWGADDPDCRKPMLWAEYLYEAETMRPDGSEQPAVEVRPDSALRAFYRELVHLRRDRAELFARGSLDYLQADSNPGVLSYRRVLDADTVLVVLNVSDQSQGFELSGIGGYDVLLVSRDGAYEEGGPPGASLAARSAVVLAAP